MKFFTQHLSIFHDSNFCLYDENNLYYLKLERYVEQKHFHHGMLLNTSENQKKGLRLVNLIVKQIYGLDLNCKRSKIDHHLRHALSMELFSNKKYDVHVVIDGFGDENVWSIFRNDRVVYQQNALIAGGSIGDIMYFLGKKLELKGHHLDFAGKVMGLQSYGKFNCKYYEKLKKYDMSSLGDKLNIYDEIKKINRPYTRQDAFYSLRDGYDVYDLSKINSKEEKIDALHTIHKRLGEIVLSIFEKYVSPNERVAYSGGVAQNVVWNTELKKRYPKLEILPHCGDEGLSFGVMEFYRKKHNLNFDLSRYPFMQSDEAPDDEPTIETIQKTARHLANGKIVAWYQGHGEVGPRALGHRSIFMDPRIKDGKDIINRVKNRELFRPFGASVLHEYAKEYFDLDFENPYMLYLGTTQKDNLDAITHVDGTCRAQTVNKDFDLHFRLLLEYFYDMTGCPVLLNTSLNEAGKPIAGWIRNAMNEFNTKAIDVLVVGNTIYEK